MKNPPHTCEIFFRVCVAALLSGMAGCALPRNPVPLDKISQAQIAAMPDIRYWDIDYKPNLRQNPPSSSDCSLLALSGGGPNGAFGAGFLCGWSAAGTRPNFKIVTGISTGALIAPLAFAGPKYDEKLRSFYTTVSTKDILYIRGILGMLFNESYAETKPLADLIDKEVDEEVLKAIAAEHAKGRRLYIGTTNLDAQRLMVWDMGAIAGSGRADAVKLFRKVMLASASIPGVFPPVYFDVEVNGKKYDEMHVDGGVIVDVFGYGLSPFINPAIAGKSRVEPCSIYVIQNGKLANESEQVPRKSLKIISRSFDTLMKSHSWKDIYQLYLVAQRNKVNFNYVSIPDSYIASAKEPFDPKEMKQLFNRGFEMAKTGYKWNRNPPGYRGTDESELIWTP